MLEFRCADVGAACRSSLKAGTKEEMVQKIAAHAAKKHGVPEFNQTLVNYALKRVRGGEEPPR